MLGNDRRVHAQDVSSRVRTQDASFRYLNVGMDAWQSSQEQYYKLEDKEISMDNAFRGQDLEKRLTWFGILMLWGVFHSTNNKVSKYGGYTTGCRWGGNPWKLGLWQWKMTFYVSK